MLIAAVVYGIDTLIYTSISPLSENSACLLGTWFLAEIVNILMVRKDKIIDMLILEYFYQFIYNVIGTGLIALKYDNIQHNIGRCYRHVVFQTNTNRLGLCNKDNIRCNLFCNFTYDMS